MSSAVLALFDNLMHDAATAEAQLEVATGAGDVRAYERAWVRANGIHSEICDWRRAHDREAAAEYEAVITALHLSPRRACKSRRRPSEARASPSVVLRAPDPHAELTTGERAFIDFIVEQAIKRLLGKTAIE